MIIVSPGSKKEKGIFRFTVERIKNTRRPIRAIKSRNLFNLNHLISFTSFFTIKSSDGKSIFLSLLLDKRCIIIGTTISGKRTRNKGKLTVNVSVSQDI
jgi:hypothetical protein